MFSRCAIFKKIIFSNTFNSFHKLFWIWSSYFPGNMKISETALLLKLELLSYIALVYWGTSRNRQFFYSDWTSSFPEVFWRTISVILLKVTRTKSMPHTFWNEVEGQVAISFNMKMSLLQFSPKVFWKACFKHVLSIFAYFLSFLWWLETRNGFLELLILKH